MKKWFYLFILFCNFNFLKSNENFDLTVIGHPLFIHSWYRLPIILIDTLDKDLKINFINNKPWAINPYNIPDPVLNIIRENSGINQPGKVIFSYESVHTCSNYLDVLPKKSLRISYSLFDTSSIPKAWVDMLNLFDAVVVPDQFFVRMYKQKGVTVPIFVLPIGLYLDEFLSNDIKKKANKIFTFGSLVYFEPKKNQKLLFQAFTKEFKNSEKVQLLLNSWGSDEYFEELMQEIENLKATNIRLTLSSLTWPDYIKFMKSFDCYVNISKGEGFSMTPREALALGIPCIVSNNMAQKTICNTGFVRAVPSKILEPATNNYNPQIYGKNVPLGYWFNCNIKDVRKSLRAVYNNYKLYLMKARKGREWVKQYRWQNLKQKYLNLIKPKKVIFGKQNLITNEYLMTNSITLYKKYKLLSQ